MSKVVIQGNASGTGNFTIAAPNSNTDRTLTLPDEAGTIITTAGVPASSLPSGSIVQTVSNTGNTTVSSTTTTLPGSEVINVSITPTSATNKLLIMATGECSIVDSTNAYAAWHIYQDDTTELARVSPGASSAILMRVVAAFNFTMTAGTTSSTKFSLYLRKGSSGTTSVSTDAMDYGISVMEIAV